MSKTLRTKPIATLTVNIRRLRQLKEFASWLRRHANEISKHPELYDDTFRARFYG